MKRIALFPSAFHPSLGGVEELSGQLALHLKKTGVTAMLCVNQWPRGLPIIEKWNGFLLRRFPFRLPEDGVKAKISFYASRSRILRELVGALKRFKAEAVHVQCVSSNAWYAHCAAHILGVPLIVSLQGERTMDAQGIYFRSPLYNRILRKVLRSAHRVTACSNATLKDADDFMGGALAGKASVIYNGIGSEAFDAGAGWPHPAPYILALGRFVPQKGFSTLLDAYGNASLCGVDLLIAGDGPDGEKLRRLTRELGLSERVHFVGRAYRGMVQALMRGALGLVVPSLREPMGIVALEGMAAGKPLLVSAVDGLKEVAPEGLWCRHAAPGDIAGFSAGLRWLAGLEVRTPVLKQQEYARQFLWSRVVQDYLSVYERAVLSP